MNVYKMLHELFYRPYRNLLDISGNKKVGKRGKESMATGTDHAAIGNTFAQDSVPGKTVQFDSGSGASTR